MVRGFEITVVPNGNFCVGDATSDVADDVTHQLLQVSADGGGEEEGVANGKQPGEGVDKEVPVPEWLRSYPEELQKAPSLMKYKTAEDALKGHLELSRKFGQKLEGYIKKPGENAKPEEWEQFYRQIGRPEKPDEYKVELTVKDADGKEKPLEVHPEFEGLLRKAVHAMGGDNKAFNAALGVVKEFEQSRSTGAVESLQKAPEEGGWGSQYKENLLKVQSTFKMVPKTLQEELVSNIGDSPALLKLMHWVSTQIGESSAPGTAEGASENTLADLMRRKEDILRDKDYKEGPRNPRFRELSEERDRIYQTIAEMRAKGIKVD